MRSILVADDAPNVRRLLRLVLEPTYRVIEAGDGDEALQRAREERPDLAILDVSMPGRSGLEVCRLLRQDGALRHIGVIVITANGTPADRDRALAAGADFFVAKPFSPTAIARLVDRTIGRPRATPE